MYALSYIGESDSEIHFTLPDHLTLPEMIENFERFLIACGYVLPEGATLGYEYHE